MLGKPLEVLSFQRGREGIESYLRTADALPLRDYVPLIEGTLVDRLERNCCLEQMVRAELELEDLTARTIAVAQNIMESN